MSQPRSNSLVMCLLSRANNSTFRCEKEVVGKWIIEVPKCLLRKFDVFSTNKILSTIQLTFTAHTKMSRVKRSRTGTREEPSGPVKKVKLAQKPSSIASKSKSKSVSSKSIATKAKPSKKIEETEPDSDPIVESDTQSESGLDDGVSWPSDEETGDLDIAAAEEGDVEPATKSQTEKENDNGLCKLFPSRPTGIPLTSPSKQHRENHTRNKRPSHRNEKLQSQTQMHSLDRKRYGRDYDYNPMSPCQKERN